jgi:uncharacterized protein YaiI (UPF0178 family)
MQIWVDADACPGAVKDGARCETSSTSCAAGVSQRADLPPLASAIAKRLRTVWTRF